MYSFVSGLLRAAVGAAIGCTLGLAGVAVGYLRAFMAPPGSPPQALLQPGAYATSIRFCLGFIIAGGLLGALWPFGRRRDGGSILLDASIGAVLMLIIAPAMSAALPNWPIVAAHPSTSGRWISDLVGGAVLGGVVGWQLRRPTGSGPIRTEPD